MITQEEIARKLLQIKAIKLSPQNPFTWASGIQSPIYCDNRIVLSFPETRSCFIDQMVDKVDSFPSFEVIAGVATAGIPWGALVADRLHVPFIYVRSKAKGHGRQNIIEGSFSTGQNVLVIEDLISTGGSSLKAVEALRKSGLNVVGVLANFQYGLKESETRFEEAGVPLITLSNYEILLEVAKDSGDIDASDIPTLREWRKAPKEWKPMTSKI
jgi:orotate phosphoribosyltransferase